MFTSCKLPVEIFTSIKLPVENKLITKQLYLLPKEVLAKGFTLEYATSLRLYRVTVLQAVVKKVGGRKKDKKRIKARVEETTAWKLEDDKYMKAHQ